MTFVTLCHVAHFTLARCLLHTHRIEEVHILPLSPQWDRSRFRGGLAGKATVTFYTLSTHFSETQANELKESITKRKTKLLVMLSLFFLDVCHLCFVLCLS